MAKPRIHKPQDFLERRERRVIQVHLEDERFDPVFRYAVETAPDRPVQDGIRDLLLQATAANAQDAAIRAGRAQAYREARDRILGGVAAFLRQLSVELDLEPAGNETQPQAGNTISADAFPASKAA